MADELQSASFQEILSIQVDEQAFGQSMDRIIEIYSQKIKDMPQLGALNTTQLSDGLTSLAENVGNVLSATANQVVESLDAIAEKINVTVAKAKSAAGGANGQDLFQARVDDEENTNEFVKNYQIRQAAAEKVEKAIAQAQATARKEMEAREAEYFSSIRAFETEREALAEENRAKDLAALKRDIIARSEDNSANNGGGFFGRIGSSIKESAAEFPELLANVTKYVVLWKLVGAAINGAGAILSAFPKAIKEGMDYLDKVESQANELQGVIVSTVQYSTDFNENMRQAGEAAQEVVKKIQDISLKDHLDADQLNKAFKAFLEGGGGQFVTTMNQAVGVTELFGLAIKAAGKDALATRTLISEIPKLLEGSITNTSNLLRVLGLTKEQWEGIRQSAMQHGNLLEQLTPFMSKYLTVAQQAAVQHSVLTQEVTLMKERIEGAIALPLWKDLTGVLQSVRSFLEENKTQIAAGAAILGQMVLSFKDILVSVIRITGAFGIWQGAAKGTAGFIALIASGFNMISTAIKFATDDFVQFIGIVFNKDVFSKGLDGIKQKYAQYQHDTEIRHAQFMTQLKEESDELDDAMNGTKTSKAAQDMANMLDKIFQPLKGPRDLTKDAGDQLQALKDQYEAALQAIKQKQQQLIATTKEQLSEHVINHQQAAAKIIGGYQAESAAVAKLVVDTQNSLDKIAGLKDKQRTAFGDKMFRDQQSVFSSGVVGEKQQQTELNKFLEQEQDKHEKAMIALEVNAAKQKAAILKQYAAQGLASQVQALDAEAAAQRKEHDAIMAQYTEDAIKFAADPQLIGEVLDKVAAEQQRYSGIVQQMALQRQKALEDEAREYAKHAETIKQNEVTLAQIQAEQAKANGASQMDQLKNMELIAVKQRELIQLKLQDAQAELARARAAGVTDPKTLDALNEQIATLKLQLQSANVGVQNAHNAVNDPTNLVSILFGTGKDNLKQAFQDASTSAQSLMNAFQVLSGTIGSLISSFNQGLIPGIANMMSKLGGFMSKLTDESTGIGGAIFKMFGQNSPLIGGILSVAGGIFSAISGVFTATARKIAAQVDSEIKSITDNFNAGNSTLKDTINALIAERNQAIAQLSGQKGGQDQLNKILPGLNAQIAQLQQQATNILQSFIEKWGVLSMGTGNTILQTWYQDWVNINKEVKQYLDAGGDAAIAQDYLNAQLAEEKLKLQTQYNQGEQQALQDAIQLNDLLKQKVDLMKQEQTAEFNILNADSIEKRQSFAVKQGQQLAQQRTQYQQQLDNLNEQISLTQQKVDIEKQVFNISSDINELHREDDALTLAALQKQIDGYKEIQKLVGSTLPGGFIPGFIPGVSNLPVSGSPGQVPIININITGPINGANGSDIADQISRRIRSGMSRF